MKPTRVRTFVHHAIAITGGVAEWRGVRAPTWDGKIWHFARLKNEADILHEIAHWIVSPAAARALPNYGLGTDPDDGPFTMQNLRPFLDAAGIGEAVRTLGRLAPDRLLELLDEKADREEELATVVTLILLRNAGLPWADRVRRMYGRLFETGGDEAAAKFWGLVAELGKRGVDLVNPLAPFERAKAGAA